MYAVKAGGEEGVGGGGGEGGGGGSREEEEEEEEGEDEEGEEEGEEERRGEGEREHNLNPQNIYQFCCSRSLPFRSFSFPYFFKVLTSNIVILAV